MGNVSSAADEAVVELHGRDAFQADAPARDAGGGEEAVAKRWAAGARGAARLADGRALRVVHPGVPGPGDGPDFRGAVLEIAGDPVRGDVEVHVRESGWHQHGHARDPAYGRVALHVVGDNDRGVLATRAGTGRAIPLLVLDAGERALPGFEPPCVHAIAPVVEAVLSRLGRTRFEEKVARLGLLVEARGPGQALYHAALETLGGPRNRAAFAEVARRLPLAALLDRAADLEKPEARRKVLSAELRWAASSLVIRFAGQRPMASPARRLSVAGGLVAALWPPGAQPALPACLGPGAIRLPAVRGLGRAARIEILANAVLPVLALATGDFTAALRAWERLPSPGTYGHLRLLEGWLARDGAVPFGRAATLQGAIQLHRTACSRGMCGRCLLSSRGGSAGEE